MSLVKIKQMVCSLLTNQSAHTSLGFLEEFEKCGCVEK